MKVIGLCLLAILACSCHESVDNPTPELSQATTERREEVRKIISNRSHTDADILRGPLSVQEVDRELDERGEAEDRLRAQEEGKPYDGKRHFIFGGPDWDRLKAKLKQGDGLYYYKSDLRSWADLLGWEGYVAIRGNEVIGTILVSMN